MNSSPSRARRWVAAVFGVLLHLLLISLISFALIDQLGPDSAYEQLGRHGSAEQLDTVRQIQDADRNLLERYVYAVNWVWTSRPLESSITGLRVAPGLWSGLKVTAISLLPGIVLGQLLALGLALLAVRFQSRWPDHLIATGALIVMSTSVVILLLGLRTMLSSESGLGHLAVSGWSTQTLADALHHALLPTLVMLIAQLGYSLSIYRTLILTARQAPHIEYLLASGQSQWRVLTRACLPDCSHAIATRMAYALPGLLIAGSLVIEQHLQIPGLGSLIYPALLSGDMAILMPVILSHALYFLMIRHALHRWQQSRFPMASEEVWPRVVV